MNMPMSIHADALQVLPAPVSTDYIVVIVNIVSIFLSVYLGYRLSERQRANADAAREKIERLRAVESLAYYFWYVLGVIVVQKNLVVEWTRGVTQCFHEVSSDKTLNRLPPFYIHDVDYKATSQLLQFVPNTNLVLINLVTTFDSLNRALESFYCKNDNGLLQSGDHEYELFRYCERLLECYDTLSEFENEVFNAGNKEIRKYLGSDLEQEFATSRFVLINSAENEVIKDVVKEARKIVCSFK